MLSLIRTGSHHPDYQKLVALLDADLRVRDGDDHAFYAQFNKSDAIQHVILAYDGNQAVGCGALKHYESGTMEVKRMYVSESCRGKGIASTVLPALEQWAKELHAGRLILETGTMQPEAIALYKKQGYAVIANYGQYAGVANSVCFEKKL